ncbi:MAG: cyclodeaminase/cyclohydrolase family protein [Nocardioidaceae bacterium]
MPLEVAEIGAEAARLASRLVVEGKHDVSGDAATALLLAEAATRSAAHLVAVNVASGGDDEELLRRAQRCVNDAGKSFVASWDGTPRQLRPSSGSERRLLLLTYFRELLQGQQLLADG